MSETKIVDGYEVQYDSEWIGSLESKTHWIYYWHQINLINRYLEKGSNIIEIGVGTKFLCNYLKSKGYLVKTVDIDEEKKPDYISSASDFDFSLTRADTVVAFEIFEHIPYSTFQKVVSNIKASNVENIIFSIPRAQRSLLKLAIKLPKLDVINIAINIPRRKIKTKNHFWELSYLIKGNNKDTKKLISEEKVMAVFKENCFKVDRIERINNIIFYLAKKTSK